MSVLAKYEGEGLWVEMFQMLLDSLKEEGKDELANKIHLMPFDAKQHFVYTDVLQKAHDGNINAIKLMQQPALVNFIKTKIN